MALQSANIPNLITLNGWAGVNQSTKARSQIDDQEVFWQENFFPTALGQLRTAWGPSAALYTVPAGVTVLRLFFGRVNDSIGATCLAFRSDGIVDQVQLTAPYTVTSLGVVWQPVAPQYFAAAVVWSPQQVGFTAGQPGGWVIGSPNGGLYAWDGTNLTGPGAPAPPWLTGGATGINMPALGSLPGVYAMEVFQDRLWVAGKTVVSFSAPNNGADFATADGGGSFPFHGDLLTISYTALQQSGGFLYLFGDSMINVISYLTLTGQGSTTNPFTTTFLNSNIDPQVGQRFFRPVGVWSHAFSLYDGDGVYMLQGNQTQKISAKLNYLWSSLNPAAFEPTFAPAHIFETKWLICLVQVTDPWGVSRPILMCWNGQFWTLASQRYNLTQIGTYEDMSKLTAYGTDGNSLYQLFAQPDPQLQKRLVTKEYKGPNILTVKDWKRAFAELRDYSGAVQGVSLIGTYRTGGGGIPNGAGELSFQLPPGTHDIVPQPTTGGGIWNGLDLQSYSPDFAIEQILLAYEDRTLWGA